MSAKEPLKGLGWPWDVLGLEAPAEDTSTVRRAYAKALKQIDQSNDIEGFAKLRQAYEAALQQATWAAKRQAEAEAVRSPVAETVAVPETIVPTPAPAAERRSPKPPDPVKALIKDLQTENLIRPVVRRILDGLQSPDSADPRYRRAVAAILRDHIRENPKTGMNSLDPTISPELLRACDQRFGWISDRRAYAKDFGTSLEMILLMSGRAYDRTSPQAKSQARAQTQAKDGFLRLLQPALPIIFVVFGIKLAPLLMGNPVFAYGFYAALFAGLAWILGNWAVQRIPNPYIPDKRAAPLMRMAIWLGAFQGFIAFLAPESLRAVAPLRALYFLTLAPTALMLGIGAIAILFLLPPVIWDRARRAIFRRS
jgi:hypothetical protein